MPSVRSAHTTMSATNPPPAADCSVPTTVIVRTPPCRTRNHTPSATSAATDRGVTGDGARSTSCIGRVIARTSSAEVTKLSASTTRRFAGLITARAVAASGGAATSTTLPTDHTAEAAAATRSRPTSTGRAPKLAPSKKGTPPGDESRREHVGHGERVEPQATGTEPITHALTRSDAPSPAAGSSGR